MSLYVIINIRTGLYWNAGKCDRYDILEATVFENSERAAVRLYQDEEWRKLP